MAQHQWLDKSHPQTLQGAVLFSYLTAALALLTFLASGNALSFGLVLLAACAYGIANDRRFAYWAGVVLSGLSLFAQLIYFFTGGGFGALLNLIFAGLLVALLLHPESRQYERVWFH
jgi:hypothetical protein